MFAAALFRDGINLRNIENIVAKFISQTMTQPQKELELQKLREYI